MVYAFAITSPPYGWYWAIPEKKQTRGVEDIEFP